MTRVQDSVDPANGQLVERVAELELEQHADREVIADLQGKITERETTNENLNAALVSSRRIGISIGILMNSLKITDEAALQLLKTNSQLHNRKMRLVAEDIILSGVF